jgi:lipopolysaccharide export system protein LptC
MRLALPLSRAVPRGASPLPRRAGLPELAGVARRVASRIIVDRRHTRRVAVLRRLLPAIGILLLLLIAIWPRLAPLWERMQVSFPAIDLRDAQELRMVNARYSGIDREGRPFVVTAVSARQIPDRQDLTSLQAPVAEIRLRSGAELRATAITAIYQSQTGVIDLFGDVTVTHQNGTRFTTQTARVHAAQNAAEGDDPVAGHGPAGEIKAQGFRVIDKGETVIFTGRTDMLLNGAGRIAARTAPPSLPAPVAVLASQVEAAATAAPPTSPRTVSRQPPGKPGARSRPPAGRPAPRRR